MYVHTSLVLNADQVVEGVLNQTYVERSEQLLGSSRSLTALQSLLSPMASYQAIIGGRFAS
jgi:hypothetical protein